MGQYFKAHVSRGDHTYVLSSWDYDCGAKLTEHSWLGNRFVNAVNTMIEEEPAKVAWVGDYSDERDCPADLYQDCWGKEEYKLPNTLLVGYKNHFYDGDKIEGYGYLVDHDKREYVSLKKYSCLAQDEDCSVMNPLPLLTAIGNGLGGGDYYKDNLNSNMVGFWANDTIEFNKELPSKCREYSDITEDVIFFDD